MFNEELGAVLQIHARNLGAVQTTLAKHGLSRAVHVIGKPTATDRIRISCGAQSLVDESRATLRGIWSETTHAIARLRDDPACADEEQAARTNVADPGLSAHVPFTDDVSSLYFVSQIAGSARPRVARYNRRHG